MLNEFDRSAGFTVDFDEGEIHFEDLVNYIEALAELTGEILPLVWKQDDTALLIDEKLEYIKATEKGLKGMNLILCMSIL